MYEILATSRFKKDVKQLKKRGVNLSLIQSAVDQLASGNILPRKYQDHQLSGDMADFRKCHILPDLLLIYKIEHDILVLTLVRTGTHSDLFS